MFSAGNTMSCVDVMYQPYATYFPYHHQRATSSMHGSFDIKKFGMSKLHDPLESSHYGVGISGPTATSTTTLPGHGSPLGGGSGTNSSSPVTSNTKEEADPDRDPPTPQSTQYLSSNCVLVTYFSGDTASNVDEHFTRALSQPSSYSSNPQHSQSAKTDAWKEVSPMSQRNFPPSFWNSHYQPPPPPVPSALSASSHQDLPGFTTDPYSHMTSSLHSMSSLHNDPWRYPLTSQSYSHHGMHDFAGYSSSLAASTSRFNTHYGSLLPGSRFGSQCDPLSKHTDSWSSRYAAHSADLTSHHDPSAMTSLHGGLSGGIETAVQDSKDLYWF